MPELLGRPQEVVVLLARRELRPGLALHLHVQAQALHLLQQHLEALGDRGLLDVLPLHDRLVRLHAADRVVALDGQHLLQGVGGPVGLQRPDLHLAEPLAAELRLAAQRLLGDERVGAGGARVDLVVHEVEQLQHVHVADRDLALVGLAGAAVVELHAPRGPPAGPVLVVDRELDRVLGVARGPVHQDPVHVLRGGPVEHRRGHEGAARACRRWAPSRRTRRPPSRGGRPTRGGSRGSGRCSCARARPAG